MNKNPQSNYAWRDRLMWFRSSSEYRALDTIDGEPMEFEWNIFPGFTTMQVCHEVQEFLSSMSTEPQDFTGRIIFMSMCNDISWGSKENENRIANQALRSFLCMQKDVHQENGLSSDLGQKRSGILLTNISHKENGTESLNK